MLPKLCRLVLLSAVRESDLIRRQMSSDSMVSVCSSGGSQQSTAGGDASVDRKKKPKVWVISRRLFSGFLPRTLVVRVEQLVW